MVGRKGKELNRGVSHAIKPPPKKKKSEPKTPRTPKTPSGRSSKQLREPTDEEYDAAINQNASNSASKTPATVDTGAKTPKETKGTGKTPKLSKSGKVMAKNKVFSIADSPIKLPRNSPRKNLDEVNGTPEKPKRKFFGSRTSPRKVRVSLSNNIVVEGNTKSAKRFTSNSRRNRSPVNLRVLKPTKVSPPAAAVMPEPPSPADEPLPTEESPKRGKEKTTSPKKLPVEVNAGENKRKLELEGGESDGNPSPLKKKKTDAETDDPPESFVTDENTKVYPIFNKQNWKKSNPEPISPNGSPVRITARAQSKMKASKGKKLEQLQIDAGQKDLAPHSCNTCNMIYVPGDENDQTEHAEFHGSVTRLIKFCGWKKEDVVWSATGARVLMIGTDSPAYAWSKLVQVTEMIDAHLGIVSNGLKKKAGLKGYLYIRKDSVEGAVIAEPITEGNRAIFPEDEKQPFCCAEEGTPAKCGINRIWSATHRRLKGVASTLVDCVRETFVPDKVLDKQELAFSDPTPSGMQFAAKYCETKEFLVYRPTP